MWEAVRGRGLAQASVQKGQVSLIKQKRLRNWTKLLPESRKMGPEEPTSTLTTVASADVESWFSPERTNEPKHTQTGLDFIFI